MRLPWVARAICLGTEGLEVVADSDTFQFGIVAEALLVKMKKGSARAFPFIDY